MEMEAVIWIRIWAVAGPKPPIDAIFSFVTVLQLGTNKEGGGQEGQMLQELLTALINLVTPVLPSSR